MRVVNLGPHSGDWFFVSRCMILPRSTYPIFYFFSREGAELEDTSYRSWAPVAIHGLPLGSRAFCVGQDLHLPVLQGDCQSHF